MTANKIAEKKKREILASFSNLPEYHAYQMGGMNKQSCDPWQPNKQ